MNMQTEVRLSLPEGKENKLNNNLWTAFQDAKFVEKLQKLWTQKKRKKRKTQEHQAIGMFYLCQQSISGDSSCANVVSIFRLSYLVNI